ncbi:DUF2971 domain-containing protein, partial [Verminephrobacter aporrectodeae subsp. tuberculatae]|nr:DUF2971 domain-containing protein [Verminephrobacter aporrectodeae subsp. tuberculatae]MCW8171581.1 DUF2971 domain-containing protein [Verminephrobacter aporrectodeae subsp. tuberculatae]MCW8171613.1 DUF2971 domain-containing protein [Verminephrobacter aporrectodeae subsp. tuberculatae]
MDTALAVTGGTMRIAFDESVDLEEPLWRYFKT